MQQRPNKLGGGVIAQLRSSVADLQGRMPEFAESAAVELEAIGGAIDLEAESVEVVDNKLRVVRLIDDGTETVEAKLPALATMTTADIDATGARP